MASWYIMQRSDNPVTDWIKSVGWQAVFHGSVGCSCMAARDTFADGIGIGIRGAPIVSVFGLVSMCWGAALCGVWRYSLNCADRDPEMYRFQWPKHCEMMTNINGTIAVAMMAVSWVLPPVASTVGRIATFYLGFESGAFAIYQRRCIPAYFM